MLTIIKKPNFLPAGSDSFEVDEDGETVAAFFSLKDAKASCLGTVWADVEPRSAGYEAYPDAVIISEGERPVTEIKRVEGTALHCQYGGQSNPQDCMVELDPESDPPTLTARYNPEIGNAVPFAVYHGRVLRWSIPILKADAANTLLEEILPLAERIVAGYDCRWDGSNHVGHLDDDATEAQEAIADLCLATEDEDEDIVSIWEASDWFSDGEKRTRAQLGITPATTDEQLEEMSARLLSEARSEGVDVLDGLDKYLTMLRDEATSIWGCIYHSHPLDNRPCTCEGEAWGGGEKMTRAEAEEAASGHEYDTLFIDDGPDEKVIAYEVDVSSCRLHFRSAPIHSCTECGDEIVDDGDEVKWSAGDPYCESCCHAPGDATTATSAEKGA